MSKKKKISGTREWAVSTINICDGCSNGCRYCYAKAMATRFGRIQCEADWQIQIVRKAEVEKARTQRQGTVMFPSSHDVTPATLKDFVCVLDKLLRAKNTVLVVSKPSFVCIENICQNFHAYQENLIFRFTIGSQRNSDLTYWEPHAPRFEERLKSLKHAHAKHFQTSVSIEPMLNSEGIKDLFHQVSPYVTDTIWIGKLNQIRKRVKIETDEDKRRVEKIEKGQTDEKIRAIYEMLKDQPKVRWKESIKEVLGLDLATEAGLDV